MFEIRHKIGINKSETKVFDALSTIQGISSWWTQDTTGEAHCGGKIQFSFAKRLDKSYDVLAEVTEIVPNKKVCWKILQGPEEWLGTEISFELTPSDDETILHFFHKNWTAQTDFMAQCNTKWAIFLLSLKNLIETGKGQPFPNDVRIGHSGA